MSTRHTKRVADKGGCTGLSQTIALRMGAWGHGRRTFDAPFVTVARKHAAAVNGGDTIPLDLLKHTGKFACFHTPGLLEHTWQPAVRTGQELLTS